MKKSILFPALALSVGLFSCSQEDLSGNASQSDQPVTVTVQLPDNVAGRASSHYIPSASDDAHQLRCILYVTNSDGSWSERIEKVESEAVGETFSFTFTPQDANDYKCTFWADFIEDDAAVTGDGNEKKYADLYYNTQSLPAVTYNAGVTTDGSLFNNDDCDAYCGTIANGAALSVELKRPFAKVSISDKGDAVSAASSISVSGYGVYNGFNIETNEVVGESETVISCSDIAPVKTDNVFFFNYLFVGNKNELPDADGNISMTVDGTTKEINVSDIILTANTKVNGSLDWANAPSDGSVSITVDIAGDWEEAADPNAPQVGDYYYSDGTWSASLDGTKTVVGVVFATADGDASSDAIANYNDVAFTDDKIHGWVVALKEMSPTPPFITSGGTLNGTEGVGSTEDDIMGYANCQAWPNNVLAEGVEYVALSRVSTYTTDYSATLPTSGTSGWYIPAVGQLMTLRTVYRAENSAVQSALQALVNTESADLIVTESGNSNYYWTSSQRNDNSVRLVTFSDQEDPLASHGGTSGRRCRPILTF